MVANDRKWSQAIANSRKRSQMVANDRKWSQAIANSRKRSQMVANDCKWSQTYCFTSHCSFVRMCVLSVYPAGGQTRDVDPMSGFCWPTVYDKCFVPKRKNKFRLKHSLYCPQVPFININYKSIDTTSISYQPLWLCCWRGDISSFLFTKN